MFENIGRKIMVLAQVLAWIGIVISIIVGLFLISSNKEELVGTGVAVLFLGSLGSWIGSFLLYGFGRLIDNSEELVFLTEKLLMQNTKPRNKRNINDNSVVGDAETVSVSSDAATENDRIYKRTFCEKCGSKLNDYTCPACGTVYEDDRKIDETMAGLENWRLQGLITEEEYQKKKKEIEGMR